MIGAIKALTAVGNERRILADSGTSAANASPFRQICGSRPGIFSQYVINMRPDTRTEWIADKCSVRSPCDDLGNLIPEAYFFPFETTSSPQIAEGSLNLVPKRLAQASQLTGQINSNGAIVCGITNNAGMWKSAVDL